MLFLSRLEPQQMLTQQLQTSFEQSVLELSRSLCHVCVCASLLIESHMLQAEW